MPEYLNNSKAVVYHGNCLEELKNLPDNSVDSIVTDPPYEFETGGAGIFRTNRKNMDEIAAVHMAACVLFGAPGCS